MNGDDHHHEYDDGCDHDDHNHHEDDNDDDDDDDDDGNQLVVVAEQVVIESLGIWVATVHLIIILFDYTIYRVVFFSLGLPLKVLSTEKLI